ncbi:MAG TPA: alpha-ribazole phosphatase family protein [Alphaproteobacteria bacterium]|nr:alpha-ribazole phosphatase family protein [Alphaproteobacteria bacterium]
MRIVLVRHPAPLIDPGTCYGRLDLPLHPDADVERLARDPLLAGSAHVWTSPSRRCRELADRIAEVLSVPLSADPRLMELDFGDWEGRPWDDIPRTDLDRWAADPLGFRAPGGESGSELIGRVTDFHAGLTQDCIVVSHGGPLRVLSALLRGQPVDLFAAPQAIGTIVGVIATP